jgi:chromosome segregation ATPase
VLCVCHHQKLFRQLRTPISFLPLHCRTTAEAMEKSRRVGTPWASHNGRREDHKRTRDELDDVAQELVGKMKRELSGRLKHSKEDADRLRRERNKVDSENDKLHAENDRLRADIDRLRAESERKSAALSQLEEQLTKRFKTALDDAFEEVLGAPMMSESADPSEDGATLPEEETAANAAENGPGEAAPSPQRDADKMQSGARASRSVQK